MCAVLAFSSAAAAAQPPAAVPTTTSTTATTTTVVKQSQTPKYDGGPAPTTIPESGGTVEYGPPTSGPSFAPTYSPSYSQPNTLPPLVTPGLGQDCVTGSPGAGAAFAPASPGYQYPPGAFRGQAPGCNCQGPSFAPSPSGACLGPQPAFGGACGCNACGGAGGCGCCLDGCLDRFGSCLHSCFSPWLGGGACGCGYGAGCGQCGGQSGCGQAGCGSGCGGWNACGPNHWLSIRGEAVFMTRESPADYAILSNTANGADVLNAEDFDFSTEAGYDITATGNLGLGWLLQVRYFELDDLEDNKTLITPAPFSFNTNPPVVSVNPRLVRADYRSDFASGEVSIGRWVGPDLSLFAGFRYAELRENLRLLAPRIGPAGLTRVFDFDTNNTLRGFQFGAEGNVYRDGRFRIEGQVKAGVYHNTASVKSIQTRPPGGPVISGPTIRNSDQVAFLGEWGLSGVYSFNEYVSIRGGYRLMYVNGVALASDQVGEFNTNPAFAGTGSRSNSNTTGDVFYHGATAGLEFQY